MAEKECMGVSMKAKGVIPSKVSELENDLKYITEEQLKDIIWKNESGEYTGLSDDRVKVIVDNLYKTIKVELLKTLEDDLVTLLPKKEGNPVDGTYLLKAVVSNNSPVFSFLDGKDLIKTTPYYYGNVSVNSSDLTEDIIKSLSNGGDERGDREYTYYSYKQYQVFAYPSSFGKLSDITSAQAGIDIIEIFDLVTVWVDGTEYYAYVSMRPSTGEYTYKFVY